jgi:hypothetical protein
MIMLSKTEREFVGKLMRGGEGMVKKEYSIEYVRQFKHRILKKRKLLTDDLLAINAVLEELQSL